LLLLDAEKYAGKERAAIVDISLAVGEIKQGRKHAEWSFVTVNCDPKKILN
jgi:hypothetical protein